MVTPCKIKVQYHGQDIDIDTILSPGSDSPVALELTRTRMYLIRYNFIAYIGPSVHHLREDTEYFHL